MYNPQLKNKCQKLIKKYPLSYCVIYTFGDWCFTLKMHLSRKTFQ